MVGYFLFVWKGNRDMISNENVEREKREVINIYILKIRNVGFKE